MATLQEAIDAYKTLEENDQIYFVTSLKKEKNKVLVEVIDSARADEKARLYQNEEKLKSRILDLKDELKKAKELTGDRKMPMDAESEARFKKMEEQLQQYQKLVESQEEQVKAAQQTAKESRQMTLRAEVFADLQVPKELRKFVTGETPEEIAASAKELLDSMNQMQAAKIEAFKAENKIDELLAARQSTPDAPAEPAAPAVAPAPATPQETPNNAPGLDANARRQYDNLVVPNPPVDNHNQPAELSQENLLAMKSEKNLKTYAENRAQIQAQLKARESQAILPRA